MDLIINMSAQILFLFLICLDFEVGRIIEQMNDSHWRVRVEATRRVNLLGSLAVPRLKIAAQEHPSLEVRMRCGIALGKWYTVLPSQYSFPDYPHYRFLPEQFLGLEREAEYNYIHRHLLPRALAEIRGSRGDKNLQARYATRLYVRKLLDAGYPRTHVQQLVDEMMLKERRQFLGDERWWEKEIPPNVADALKRGLGPCVPTMATSSSSPN
jgi:hypothetical protein